jgi:hypothetical protein
MERVKSLPPYIYFVNNYPMVDVDISKDLQVKNKTKKFRSSTTFAELMAYSPVEAAQYAIDC